MAEVSNTNRSLTCAVLRTLPKKRLPKPRPSVGVSRRGDWVATQWDHADALTVVDPLQLRCQVESMCLSDRRGNHGLSARGQC